MAARIPRAHAPHAFQAFDPATGAPGDGRDALDRIALDALLAEATAGQATWADAPLAERCRAVVALGEALRAQRDVLADALVAEVGKPVTAARAEVDKCAWLCDWAAAAAPEALADEVVLDEPGAHARVIHRPLGTILAVMPWNFPYWQALRAAVPALLAGNGVLVKPAPSVPACARRLDDVVRAAGLTDPVAPTAGSRASGAAARAPAIPCRTAWLDEVGVALAIADRRVAGVTLTGSTRAGRAVAALAGAHLKPVVLELGGSDPFVVLPDADIAAAARVAAAARTVNGGQSCIAAKRFVVCEPVHDAFLAAFTEAMRAAVVGDPRDPRTDIGPLATRAGLATLDRQVRESIAAGARVVLGGAPLERPGWFYPPTILADVPASAPAAREELFGPVAAVFRVPDADAALAVANDTPYGLGASLWTRDPDAVRRAARTLHCGMLTVNDLVASDPRVPFGGIGDSGFGRELGTDGFRSFTNRMAVRTRAPLAE